MKTLTICLIVKNEEDTIKDALLSCKDCANEIIVVDTGSVDNTKNIINNLEIENIHLYDFEWCYDFSAARNYVYNKATCDYIMFLDADERITNELRDVINQYKIDDFKNLELIRVNIHHVGSQHFTNRIVKNQKTDNFQYWVYPVHEYLGKYVTEGIVGIDGKYYIDHISEDRHKNFFMYCNYYANAFNHGFSESNIGFLYSLFYTFTIGSIDEYYKIITTNSLFNKQNPTFHSNYDFRENTLQFNGELPFFIMHLVNSKLDGDDVGMILELRRYLISKDELILAFLIDKYLIENVIDKHIREEVFNDAAHVSFEIGDYDSMKQYAIEHFKEFPDNEIAKNNKHFFDVSETVKNESAMCIDCSNTNIINSSLLIMKGRQFFKYFYVIVNDEKDFEKFNKYISFGNNCIPILKDDYESVMQIESEKKNFSKVLYVKNCEKEYTLKELSHIHFESLINYNPIDNDNFKTINFH